MIPGAIVSGDIFDIPDVVHQGDFVLRATQGLIAERRAETPRRSPSNSTVLRVRAKSRG